MIVGAAPRIQTLRTAAEMDELAGVLNRVWGRDEGRSLMDVSILVALQSAGHYVAAAREDDRIVGGCVGFFAEPLGEVLHSHIAAVEAGAAGRGIGRAMKEHQAQWCRDRGIRRIQWTYDPLVARNAHFNFTVLGARPAAYKTSVYGTMADAINDGDDTDRLLVSWTLDGTAPARPPINRARAAVILSEDDAGRPVATPAPDADVVALRIPRDIERMRVERPADARLWRRALRDALAPLVGSPHWRADGFTPDTGYVFTKEHA